MAVKLKLSIVVFIIVICTIFYVIKTLKYENSFIQTFTDPVSLPASSVNNISDTYFLPTTLNSKTSQDVNISELCFLNLQHYDSQLQAMRTLSSDSCCRPFQHLRLVNDSHDPLQTYMFPAQQLQFTEPAMQVCNESTELLIAVKSSFENFKRRQAQRSASLSTLDCLNKPNETAKFCLWAHSRTKLLYFLSTPSNTDNQTLLNIAEETKQHGDLIQLSLMEHYHNLTLKTTASLYWALSRCPSARYVVSADDDMKLDVTNIWRTILSVELKKEHEMLSVTPQLNDYANNATGRLYNTDYLGGLLYSHSAVMRGDRWMVTVSAYALPYYPPYHVGWFVLMSASVAEQITRAAMCTRLLWVDDAFLFGILSQGLNIKRNQISSYNEAAQHLK